MDSVNTAEQLIEQVHQLITLPEIYFKIEKMLQNGQYSNREFGKIISQDPALTTRLLQIVNSALYNYGGRIDTVSRAVTLIGHKELKSLLVISSVAKIFENLPSDLLDVMQMWRKSLLTGITCRLLATRCHVLHPERLFIAGLLHDIGHLVIYSNLPQKAAQIIPLTRKEPQRELAIEQHILGFDYTEVNFYLAQDWCLPQSLQVALKYHRTPEQVEQFQLETALVHIAMAIACLESDEQALENISAQAWQACNLNESIVEEVRVEAGVQFSEVLELILPH